MTLTCYIVDDEPHAISILRDLIQKTPGLELLGHTTDPLAGLQELASLRPALVFLDVDMPELSGLEFARLAGPDTTIVFTTAYREYAPEAFDREAADYLLKPIAYERFLQCIQKIRRQNTPAPPDCIYVKTGIKGRLERIDLAAIRYVSGSLNYIEIHVTDRKIITYLTLTEILTRLPATDFSRIHRSFIVRHTCISTLEPGRLKLRDGTELPIGRSHRAAFSEKIDSLVLLSSRDQPPQ